MLTAAIFFKGLGSAKSRLKTVLSPLEREAFARQMLLRVIDCARGASGIGEIIIVTPEPEIMAIVGRRTVKLLREPRPAGLNAAAEFAAAELAAEGRRRLLILPADLPRIGSADIDRLVEASERAGCDTIVPSCDGTGTNALVIELPPRFRLAFGPDSFRRHLANAAGIDHQLAVHRCAKIGIDVDQPADLERLPLGTMS